MGTRKVETDVTASRITMQYRKGSSRVCELDSAGTLLDVHVSAPRDGQHQWQVAAHSGRDDRAVIITEFAATGTEALEKVARTWSAKAHELGLRSVDWKAVSVALIAVHAI